MTMKTIQSIIIAAAAIFLVASCDDDSMNTDKAKVSDVFGNDKVEVVVTDTSYNLSWKPYTIYAGSRLAICTQYDVFVTPVYFDDTQKELYEPSHHWYLITTVDSCCAQVSKNSVDTIFDDNSYFAFRVFPSGIGLNYASDNNFILSQTLNSFGRDLVLIGASADPTMGHVEVSGEGEENMRKIGETVELTAIAYEGYKFVQWSDGSTENPRKLFVDGDVELVAKFSIYMTPLQYENTDFYFNKWFTDGSFASPLEIKRVGDDNNLAYAIEVPSAGDDWTIQFCNVIHGTQGQAEAEGNKFTFDCDVYWERASDNSHDTADIHLLTGKMGYYAVHDDWQWSPEDNTELITNNEGSFWGYVHNQLREIPNKEWTHVSWGDELIIGEKGADYIGIQINLTNPAGTNNGTFYFRNIEIRMGNYNYIFEY